MPDFEKKFSERLRGYRPIGDPNTDFASFQRMVAKGGGAAGAGLPKTAGIYKALLAAGVFCVLSAVIWGMVSSDQLPELEPFPQAETLDSASLPQPDNPGPSVTAPTMVDTSLSSVLFQPERVVTEQQDKRMDPSVKDSNDPSLLRNRFPDLVEAVERTPQLTITLPTIDYRVVDTMQWRKLPAVQPVAFTDQPVDRLSAYTFRVGTGIAYAPNRGYSLGDSQVNPYLSVSLYRNLYRSKWGIGAEVSLTNIGNALTNPEAPYVRSSISQRLHSTGPLLGINMAIFNPYLLQLGPAVRYALNPRLSVTGGVNYTRLFYRQEIEYSANIPANDPLRLAPPKLLLKNDLTLHFGGEAHITGGIHLAAKMYVGLRDLSPNAVEDQPQEHTSTTYRLGVQYRF